MASSGRRQRGRNSRRAALALGFALALVVLELGLRLAPRAISPQLLILFEPGLRASIADGAYPVRRDYVELERDDDGPPLRIPRPGSRIVSIDESASGAPRVSDERGFCNPPGSYEGRDSIDLIALGDSFTWCHAVETSETWTHRLGEKTGLSVYNLGRGGIGPYEYLQLLRAFGLQKKPRAVILNVYGGNDLRDAQYFAEHRAVVRRTGRPPREEPEPLLPALSHGTLGRHSYALNLLASVVSRALHRARTRDAERSGVDFRYTLETARGPIELNVDNRDRGEVSAAHRLADGRISPSLWDEALERFAALSREHGFVPILSYVPSAHGAYAGRLRFADPQLEPLLAAFGAAQRAHLEERSAALGLVFHDLTPALLAAADTSGPETLLYGPTHVHLTPRGHDVVAEALARALEDAKIPTRADPTRSRVGEHPEPYAIGEAS